MSGGQAITSGQGTVTQDKVLSVAGIALASGAGTIVADAEDGIAISGSSATLALGTAVSGPIILLRSRKVGSGSATAVLLGGSGVISQGIVIPVPSKTPASVLLTGSLGTFAKTRSRALSGAATISAQGGLVAQGAPGIISATIPSSGASITLVFSQTVTFGAGGNGGVVVGMSGGASTATYSSGSGTTTLVYSLARTINIGETGTLAYTQPGNGIESASSGGDVASFSGITVANNSTNNPAQPVATTIFDEGTDTGTQYFVRPDGSSYGTGVGTSWTNAWSGFSGINWTSINAGDTVWIAGGTYTQNLACSKAGASGNPIKVRRARSDSVQCTAGAGWSAGFDSNVNHLSAGITFSASDVLVSGAKVQSGGVDDVPSSYGWKIDQSALTTGRGINWPSSSNRNTVRWFEMEGAGPSVNITGNGHRAVNMVGTGSGHIIGHCWMHDWESAIYCVSASSPTFEYIIEEDIHAQNWSAGYHPNGIITWGCPNGIVRFCTFRLGPQGFACGEGVFFEQSGGSTAWQIYGNLFKSLNYTGVKAIEITSAVGAIKIFNNTFIDILEGTIYTSDSPSATGGEQRNNFVYQCAVDTVSGITSSNNITASGTSSFTNYAAGDYRPTANIGSGLARNAGTALTTDGFIDKDRLGKTRGADGTWDVGAYEFSYQEWTFDEGTDPGTQWYVRPSGGGGSGTSWTNAWNGLSAISWASVQPGDTVWIAGGSYNQDLNCTKSGTVNARIKVRRARADSLKCRNGQQATPATNGWNAAYDAQVRLDVGTRGITLNGCQYVDVSGAATQTGGNTTHGIYVAFPATGESYCLETPNARFCEIRWVEVEGAGFVNYSGDTRGLSMAGGAGTASDITFRKLKIHKVTTGVMLIGRNNITFDAFEEFNLSAVNSASWHPNGIYCNGVTNLVVKNSWFHKGPAGTGANDPHGCGEGIFSEGGGGNSGWLIYGNIFQNLDESGTKAIEFQASVPNCKIMNNTFDNVLVPITGSAGSGTETRNNIFSRGSATAGTASNNLTTTDATVFINRAIGDFHITSAVSASMPRNAGMNLGSPYDIDREGNTRGADGTWDIGAYEYT